MLFFLLTAFTGIGLGFTGFQIIAACDRLGFASIDYMGIVLILLSAPLAILSINHVSKGLESLKFTGLCLTAHLCFMYFQGGALHAVIGASSLFHPLYSMVSVIFILAFFICFANFLWRVVKKDYVPEESFKWYAIAGFVAVFIIALPITSKLRVERNNRLIKYHSTWTAKNSVRKNMITGSALSVQLSMPEKAEIKEAFMLSAKDELDALQTVGMDTVVLNDQFSMDSSRTIINTKITDLIKKRKMKLFIQDSMGPWPSGKRITWKEFYNIHKQKLIERARILQPKFYSLAGAPEYYRLIGVTGEFSPEKWAEHILDSAIGVKKVSPNTTCGFYVSVKELFSTLTRDLVSNLQSEAALKDGDASVSGAFSENSDVSICPGYYQAFLNLEKNDPLTFESNLSFMGAHIYFEHQIKRLEKLVELKKLPIVKKDYSSLKFFITECWHGWALAPPRLAKSDLMWLEATYSLVKQAGAEAFYLTPFGNYYKNRYFNSFGKKLESKELSVPFKGINDIIKRDIIK